MQFAFVILLRGTSAETCDVRAEIFVALRSLRTVCHSIPVWPFACQVSKATTGRIDPSLEWALTSCSLCYHELARVETGSTGGRGSGGGVAGTWRGSGGGGGGGGGVNNSKQR